jgi:hypothetical protein
MRYPDASLALALIVFFGPGPLSVSAGAQQAGDGGRASTIPCSKETTRVDSIGQRVRLTGDCRSVVVSGSGNRVVIERVGSLNVSGTDNEVRWERSLQGDAPRVVTSGIKNVVMRVKPAAGAGPGADAAAPEKPRPATPPPPAPRAAAPTTGSEVRAKVGDRLLMTESGQTLNVDCASRPVTVSGSTNIITLTGTCGQLSVSGTGNKITVERTPRIVTTGHNNEIKWQHGEGDRQPALRNSGMNNTVRRGGL